MRNCKYCGGVGKLNKRNIKDLQTIILHTKMDLDYGEGGSYIRRDTSENLLHKTDIASAKRAIKLIQEIIKTS